MNWGEKGDNKKKGAALISIKHYRLQIEKT